MQPPNLNEVLAKNLRKLVEEKHLNTVSLAKASGLSQRTMSNYLSPELRLPGKTGKMPSAKLSEVAALANALGVKPWDLLRDMTDSEREMYRRIEAAYLELTKKIAHSSAKKIVSGLALIFFFCA